MRTRAYRPEIPRCLEDRSLLSGVAGPSADPVVFSRHRLSFIVDHIQDGFAEYARTRDPVLLHDEIYGVIVMLPFGRVDGITGKIDRIVARMQREFRAHVPHAFRRARIDVNAAIRADIEARVRAGDLIVR
jgi:hypothetical protein